VGNFYLGSLAGALTILMIVALLLVVARLGGRRWALLTLCVLVVVGCGTACLLLPTQQSETARPSAAVSVDPPEVSSAIAYTDAGSLIELSTYDDDDFPVEQRRADEALLNRDRPFTLIRTAEADPVSNCHGWVFTAGRFWVDGSDVNRILDENGYKEVSEPMAGDLIIYRGPLGEVQHSGLVRVAGDIVLVEGKWKCLGCYLHSPGQYPYVQNWTYYRSPRHGHVLQMPSE
jgi:hypothetical protein